MNLLARFLRPRTYVIGTRRPCCTHGVCNRCGSPVGNDRCDTHFAWGNRIFHTDEIKAPF